MPPVYAQISDFEAYVEGWVTTDSDALNRLLMRAEHDLDQRLFPPVAQLTVADRKVDPTTLTDEQTAALTAATCAQAEYRNAMGEDFFVRGQYESVSGPGGFSQKGRQPYIGPKVKAELAGTGLLTFGYQSSPQRRAIR